MELKTLKLSELKVAEKNVRMHPQKQIEELKRSYEMFGQYRPLVVDSDGKILVGNGLFTALSELGVDEVKCYVLPQNATEDYKKKLMLADNKIFDLGKDDITNIDELLPTLADFEIPGFDEDVLNEIYGSIDFESIGGAGGNVTEEVVENIKKAESSREEVGQTDDVSKYVVKQEVQDMYNKAEDKTRYITCPHCGIKIWLE